MYKAFLSAAISGALLLAAFSSSPSYKLQNYGLGSGATNTASSPNYKLNGNSGEVNSGPSTGTTDTDKSGSTQTQQANVPLAPTLSNGSSTYYNKLSVVINTTGSDASDYQYSIAVSTDSFTTTNYVQADGTLGGAAVYQTYAAWGGASGSFIIGLTPGTTYQAKVNAVQGAFTASAYGAAASAATVNPSLTFSITPSTVALGSLLAGTVVTGGSNISFGFATNGGSGGAVYIAGANAGLKSATNNYTIPAYSGDLAGQSQGFGAQGLTATQTSGGPLSIVSPYNGSGTVVGAEATTYKQLFTAPAPTVGGSATAALKGKASVTTPAGSDYSETLTFVASASF